MLFQSAEALEQLHKVDTVVLDKTGTVTEGHPSVTDVFPVGCSAPELLRVALSLEQPSEHPLAEAVVRFAQEQGAKAAPVSDFHAESGKGIRAMIDGKPCLAGNAGMLEAAGISVDSLSKQGQKLAAEGKTPLYFAQDGRVIGMIAAADVVKPTSAEAIRALRALKIDVSAEIEHKIEVVRGRPANRKNLHPFQ